MPVFPIFLFIFIILATWVKLLRSPNSFLLRHLALLTAAAIRAVRTRMSNTSQILTNNNVVRHGKEKEILFLKHSTTERWGRGGETQLSLLHRQLRKSDNYGSNNGEGREQVDGTLPIFFLIRDLCNNVWKHEKKPGAFKDLHHRCATKHRGMNNMPQFKCIIRSALKKNSESYPTCK